MLYGVSPMPCEYDGFTYVTPTQMLWDALKRAHLVGGSTSKRGSLDGPELPSAEDASGGRFSLDTVIEEEGANLSVGQVSSTIPVLCIRLRNDLSVPCPLAFAS